jgi:putative flavoprotein involved in K+ transport
MIEAVVIGAGQAGLAASYHLRQHGIEHVVLESGRIGESWRSQRWDSFVLNTPNWMSQLPGEGEPVEARDAFLGRDAFVDHLEAYVRDQRLAIREGSEVTAVRPNRGRTEREAGTFTVRVSSSERDDELVTRSVIVASGGQRVPRIPAIAGSLPAEIAQLAGAGYRAPRDLPPGSVLVVGSAQTGVQVVEDLLESGRRVYLCTSAVGRYPRRYRGRDVLEWLSGAGAFDIPTERLPDPSVRLMPTPLVSGVGHLGHTVSLQGLAAQGAILLGRPIEVHGTRLRLDQSVGPNVALGDRISAETKGQIDQGIVESGDRLPPLEPDDPDRAHPDPLSIRAPEELDLEAAGVTSVIWTTGFRGDFGYLPAELLDPAGQPVQVHGITSVAGVFCIGLPWQTRRRSALISGVDLDAAFVAERLAEHLAEGGRSS